MTVISKDKGSMISVRFRIQVLFICTVSILYSAILLYTLSTHSMSCLAETMTADALTYTLLP